MADDPLMTYLRDHLAGARAAVEMIEHLADRSDDPLVLRLTDPLLAEVRADRATLEELTQALGGGPSPLKDAVAWLGEKVSRLKLGELSGADGALPTFEALEALALGIQGKLALWEALAEVAEIDHRLRTLDLSSLANRARDQYARVEECRLVLARRAFTPRAD